MKLRQRPGTVSANLSENGQISSHNGFAVRDVTLIMRHRSQTRESIPIKRVALNVLLLSEKMTSLLFE